MLRRATAIACHAGSRGARRGRVTHSLSVARCRVASKAFDAVSPGPRSINLRYSKEWHNNSSLQSVKPFKTVLLDLISQMSIVESVCLSVDTANDDWMPDVFLTDDDFVMDWLPRVSKTLKSLSISDSDVPDYRFPSDVLPLISKYCPDLVNLTVSSPWLSINNLNPMPMLKSLTLSNTTLDNGHLTMLNTAFPNLQLLNLIGYYGGNLQIHLHNLKTCYLGVFICRKTLTLITPNLITLEIQSSDPVALHLEAPLLSHLHLSLNVLNHAGAFVVKKFENLKTLLLESSCIGSILSEFPITKTVENVTLDSKNGPPFYAHTSDSDTDTDTDTDTTLTLGKVFAVFPNVSSLCIRAGVWSDLEACLNQEDWDLLDGRKGLKSIRVYLKLVDPSLTFSSVTLLLDQCVGLSEVSLLIHNDVVETVSKSFMSKCMARWPGLKWRWGIWTDDGKDELEVKIEDKI